MKTINHEVYVSLEVAKLLKEAGFDWECYRAYDAFNGEEHISGPQFLLNWNDNSSYPDNTYISKPTLDVAQRWLRETKGYAVSVYPSDESDGWLVSLDLIEDSSSIWTKDLNNTYEEALEAGIKKALEIILEKGE